MSRWVREKKEVFYLFYWPESELDVSVDDCDKSTADVDVVVDCDKSTALVDVVVDASVYASVDASVDVSVVDSEVSVDSSISAVIAIVTRSRISAT